PLAVGGTGWTAVAAGSGFTCAKKSDHSLWCWGDNYYGQLGDGTTTNHGLPAVVAGAWQSVSAGLIHTCAIGSDGALSCWGGNVAGQLGDGSTTAQAPPVRIRAARD